jgi:hypothetical protein
VTPRRALIALAALALLALAALGSSAGVARAQCVEPSAPDLRAGAEPLRVAAAAGGAVALTWEDTGAPAYSVHEGTLGGLRAGAPDHARVATPGEPRATIVPASAAAYFLAGAECVEGGSSLGRDSDGRERARESRVRVVLGIAGAAGVFGIQAALGHPADRTFLAPSGVAGHGAYEAGASGAPLVQAASPDASTVTALATFSVFDPDPSFDAPADVLSFVFSHAGMSPAASDFAPLACDVRDQLGTRLPGASCVVTAVEPLP